jgi:hypothetical protein
MNILPSFASKHGSRLVLEDFMPERIQLSRRRGWRMPENTVKVDRTTQWGNPFDWKDVADELGRGRAQASAVETFRQWLAGEVWGASPPPLAMEIQSALRGRNLACWCALGTPCHADVLLQIANREEAGDR